MKTHIRKFYVKLAAQCKRFFARIVFCFSPATGERIEANGKSDILMRITFTNTKEVEEATKNMNHQDAMDYSMKHLAYRVSHP
jgi:hypothetical protein